MPQRITRQPHTFANGQVLTWDGHLDNRDDLARELHVELTARTTDLAIVAAGYERFGCDSFKRLVGDWALVVWDPHSREMGSGGMRPGSAVFNLRITRMSCRPRGTAQRRTSKEDCKLDAEKAAKQLSRRVQDLYEFRRAGYEWNEIAQIFATTPAAARAEFSRDIKRVRAEIEKKRQPKQVPGKCNPTIGPQRE